MKSLWSSYWIGMVISIASILTSVIYTAMFGPMFGEWGWLHISVALLILGVLTATAVCALDQQPIPYRRTHPMYDLKDIPAHSGFRAGGFTWLTQLIPMVLSIALLFIISRVV